MAMVSCIYTASFRDILIRHQAFHHRRRRNNRLGYHRLLHPPRLPRHQHSPDRTRACYRRCPSPRRWRQVPRCRRRAHWQSQILPPCYLRLAHHRLRPGLHGHRRLQHTLLLLPHACHRSRLHRPRHGPVHDRSYLRCRFRLHSYHNILRGSRVQPPRSTHRIMARLRPHHCDLRLRDLRLHRTLRTPCAYGRWTLGLERARLVLRLSHVR